ncbi:3-deoxy-manno-octulosonate cytidylyltransferase [Desulfobacula phenolica]|uniref:3-deoxy-manno-octulosonate cytidylyltransferase n=1 Tax=Desulfobacula phenolica TaxID=90732 RepID=A0A1H2DNA0_9BACT|nr:3-deoxy-manno-octulosonate cytidylyltransferase [Desulfobacula phenolica]SDT84204.1 3-deoxy-manno-octulosonate cytidylyltransferase (CMP-KDO synthetase) [Desulfobacula phenolica]
MCIAVIPSRFGSKRFNGKPLATIAGKPMIQRVYEQAVKAKNIERVIIATDDDRILKVVEGFGGEAVMTSSNLRSGTDRVAETANLLNLGPDEIIVNIQGDQPLFNSECLDQLVEPFQTDPELTMSTLAVQIKENKDASDPGNVKVIFDKNGFALYFSRSEIPHARDKSTEVDIYKHLGFYAYKKSFIDTISALPDSTLESIEKLEQLRVLEYGYKIKVIITEHDSPSVDRPEDIPPIEKNIRAK